MTPRKEEPVFEKIEQPTNKPFIDWDKTPEIEGKIENIREIKSDYGAQEVCDIGDWTVNISAALKSLPRYEGEYLKIKYLGMQENKKGTRTFRAFEIYRRK
jgi:hypothetical protein